MEKVLTIGIAGGTNSGKTTISQRLKRCFANQVTTLYYDNYYYCHDGMSMEARNKINYDEPAAFETDLFVQHIEALQNGEPVDGPIYDFTVHNREKRTQRLNPSPVLLIEGILVLAERELRDRMDIKIFVDTDADVRVLRRIARDTQERGRSLESIMNQYLTTVKPMHELYVEPSKKHADIIIPVGGQNEVALEMLIRRIRTHLEENI